MHIRQMKKTGILCYFSLKLEAMGIGSKLTVFVMSA